MHQWIEIREEYALDPEEDRVAVGQQCDRDQRVEGGGEVVEFSPGYKTYK